MYKLTDILGAVRQATGIQPTAFNTTTINDVPAINYLTYIARDDGAKQVWRLQVRITAKTLSEVIRVDRQVRNTLVTLGDETKFGAIIEVNGGGSLEDELTGFPQMIIYFDITTKGEQ